MNKQKGAAPTQAENKIRRSTLITVIWDVVLIAALVFCLFAYNTSNQDDAYHQNVENITNIATGKSQLMLSALENTSHDVENAYRYCNGKSVDQVMAYLSLICDEDDEYQLLMRDQALSTDLRPVYAGWSTRKADGVFLPVLYNETDLAISIDQYADRDAGEICYSQSFTNVTDAMRYFSVFCGLDVVDNGAQLRVYLVKPQKENKVLDQLQSFSQYGELATAICYPNGKYLAQDSAFRSDNFFDYLYTYNGLSLDERNAMRAYVQSNQNGAGLLTYRDYKGRDCVFAYAACGEEKNWYVIVSVPISDFVSAQLISFFTLIIILFLAALLVFNIWRLLLIMQQLRQSAQREQVANASKSLFLSRMSHEIRTPLNAVIGYTTIAKNEMTQAKDDAARRQAASNVLDCLEKSEIASKHLLTIINDVLDMSAIESGKVKVSHDRFDFKGLITSLTTVFYSQARAKDVDFEVIFDTLTEEWFVGDQLRVSQILANILSNAVKFTPQGGKIVLKISQPEADTNASHIRFEISDTGIGMTRDYLDRIWEPFEQADSSISRRFGGTGLGLSITKHLIDLMGGAVTVESAPGKGTTFRIDLTFERTRQPKHSGVYAFDTVNALVVDDDASTCEYVRLLFNRCGAKCAAVTSGEDAVTAVSLAAKEGAPYTLCLMDWRMPDMDGMETIQKIRDVVGDAMPIVVLTAYDFVEISDKAAALGIERFIAKPLFQSSLFDLLTNVSQDSPSVSVETDEHPDFAGARILLAEDNAMNMEIARRILKAAGLTVDSAWNGKQAVEMFENCAPGTYMAILMDVHMPEMDGHEATRAIRAGSHPEAKTIPIIAMTADAFAENVAEAFAAGMNDHIAKPIDVPLLLDTLMKYRKKS